MEKLYNGIVWSNIGIAVIFSGVTAVKHFKDESIDRAAYAAIYFSFVSVMTWWVNSWDDKNEGMLK